MGVVMVLLQDGPRDAAIISPTGELELPQLLDLSCGTWPVSAPRPGCGT